jgi:single-strand DNA-binding protein
MRPVHTGSFVVRFGAERIYTMNTVNLIGRLTKDPEIRTTDDDRSVCTFNLAVDDVFSKEDRADFIRITVFGSQADLCGKYLQRGFLAGVNGRLRSDVYTDAEGVRRHSVSIAAERVQFLQWPDRQQGKSNPDRGRER